MKEYASDADLAIWFELVGIKFHEEGRKITYNGKTWEVWEYVIDALPGFWQFSVVYHEHAKGLIRFIIRPVADRDGKPQFEAVAEYEPKDGTLHVFDQSWVPKE